MTTPSIPSPVLIYGDRFVCLQKINAARERAKDVPWFDFSMKKDDWSDISTEVTTSTWSGEDKLVMIRDVPNQKAAREFLIELCVEYGTYAKIIIWDSLDAITDAKTWTDFVAEFKTIHGSKVVFGGTPFDDKGKDEAIIFTIDRFKSHGKEIERSVAETFVNITGYNRGLIASEVEKLTLTCSSPVSREEIIFNTFRTAKMKTLYELGTALDTGSYELSIEMLHKFLESGMNENVLADVMVRKARWQLIAASYWKSGCQWSVIPDMLVEMGQFPSAIWHNDSIAPSDRRRRSDGMDDRDGIHKYATEVLGLPDSLVGVTPFVPKKTKTGKEKKATAADKKLGIGRSERIPMRFMAAQIASFVRHNIVSRNKGVKNLKNKVFNRALNVYSSMHNNLVAIRYGEDSVQQLHEMVRSLTSTDLE